MRGTRPLPLQIQVQAHVSAEGRGRTDTRVAPQQFLRLSRLPIPPLRPAFRSVKVASGSRLFCRFFPRYFAKSLAPPAYRCLAAMLYRAVATACRALNHFTFCRHNATPRLLLYHTVGAEHPTLVVAYIWCRGPESDWGHRDFQSRALPTELPGPTNKTARTLLGSRAGILPRWAGSTGSPLPPAAAGSTCPQPSKIGGGTHPGSRGQSPIASWKDPTPA